MDDWFSAIVSDCELASDAARQLCEKGFVVIPGPVAPARWPTLAAAYDAAVSDADPADVRTGRTTTRVHDFVSRGVEFDELYLHKPILGACCNVIGRPFKLSTMHARTLNPGSPAQDLHVDFPRGATDRAVNRWPMVGFIFMIDEFRHANASARTPDGAFLDVMRTAAFIAAIAGAAGSVGLMR